MLPESYSLIQAKPEELSDLINFLYSDFFVNDPMSVMKVPRECSEPMVTGVVTRGLANGFVYYIKNANNEFVALRSAVPRTRDELSYIKTDKSEDAQHPFKEFNRKMLEKLHLWDHISPEVNKILWISVLSVRLDETRKGFAKEMILHDFNELKEKHGFQAVCAVGAAIKSQMLFKSLDFEVLTEILHKDIVSDATGERIMNCVDGTDRHQLLCRYL